MYSFRSILTFESVNLVELLKTVEFSSGKKIFYPYTVYSYKTVQETLQSMFLRTEFYANCQLWRNRTSHSNTIEDIYNGAIWKEFQSYLGSPFLILPHSFAFVLNVDWFQPYTHTASSVGVLYLTVLNLPRKLRYKRENTILVGIIPGPHEPKLNINSFLKPLVEEMLQLWNGLKMSVNTQSGVMENVIVKGAILCVACDLPAGRKTCGFLGHTANYGCSKCLKTIISRYSR